MPTVVDEQIVQLEFADLFKRRVLDRPASPAPRSPGVHLSGVLSHIAREIGVLKQYEQLEEEMPLIMALGLAWEEFAVSLYPDIDWQPGEVEREGVWMTCDGLSAFDIRTTPLSVRLLHTSLLEEFKFTFKAVRTAEEWLQEWYYMHQSRAYCIGYGPRLVRWHVCHVRGDYRTFGPIYKQYVVEFTDRECEQTMIMVAKNKHMAIAKGE